MQVRKIGRSKATRSSVVSVASRLRKTTSTRRVSAVYLRRGLGRSSRLLSVSVVAVEAALRVIKMANSMLSRDISNVAPVIED